MGMSRFSLCRTALLLCAIFSCGSFQQTLAVTRTSDVNALEELGRVWPDTARKLNWAGDPCNTPWVGVTCDPLNTTVTALTLDYQGIVGSIPPVIGDLDELITLEMSNNRDLGGELPRELGNLVKLELLSLQYCKFSGPLPSEIGNLRSLNFMGLNGNKLNGSIPAELGFTNLTWLDISDNAFSGDLPMARNSPDSIGLDNLTTIVHFHLNNNSLTGSVPEEFFSLPNVLHVMLDHNRLSGNFPDIQSTGRSLTVVRLDANNLQGEIPTAAFGNATSLLELNFKDNSFSGPLPDFSHLPSLQLLDLSDNDFTPQDFPSWATSLQSMTTLNLAEVNIFGEIPPSLFELPNLQRVDLSGNNLNGSLTFSNNVRPNLTIDVQNNSISGFLGNPSASVTIMLEDNPICRNLFITIRGGCESPVPTFSNPADAVSQCGTSDDSCSGGKKINPKTCLCAYPLDLTILLTAPVFSNLDEAAPPLESDLTQQLNRLRAQQGGSPFNVNQFYIDRMFYLDTGRVDVIVRVFPASGDSLSRDDGNWIILQLQQHKFSLAAGPFLLPNAFYTVASSHGQLSTAAIIGIVVGCGLGVLIIGCSLVFAIYHKKRADKAVMSNPFASWGGGSAEFGEAPKLKGARWFSLAELKAYTNNWSVDNQIGEGGYGKVYRGLLPNNDVVAIKRATEGSMQGANEFKNEIELLSRVHHRNLVGLVGFCYEGGEQALIYEYMSNGTLSDHLKGRADAPLSWGSRLRIALQSARGLAYLHNHATPPIIHRDIKSANILLTDNLEVKVADFGLSKLAPDEGEKLVYSVHVKGTLGYLDPEYYMTQNLTDKSDVYSFGVVMLELLTARPPIDGGRFVVREMRTALDKGGLAAIRPLLDPALKHTALKDLDAYLKIALSCVEETSAERPTIAEVVKQLEGLDVVLPAKSALDTEGGKKVKFADEPVADYDDALLLVKGSEKPKRDSFKYSGSFGISTTIRPK